MRVEPRVQALAGDFADEDHGIGNLPIWPAGVGHAVQGDGHLVEVALGVDADGVNEFLVLGGVLGRLQLFVEEGADGPEIDVDDAVGFGQQARGLGRSFGAQEDCEGHQNQEGGDNQ